MFTAVKLAAVVATSLITVSIAGCGSSGTTGAPEESVEPAAPTAEDVATWPKRWCEDVHVGQNRTDIVATMGAPTETYADQDQWDGFGYHFTAFYDETGTASQLDINELGMSDAQKAKITCNETRS